MDAEEELSERFIRFLDKGSIRKLRSSKRKLSGSSGHALSENSVVLYSGLQNRCNVWPFSTGLNVALNRVEIALRVG